MLNPLVLFLQQERMLNLQGQGLFMLNLQGPFIQTTQEQEQFMQNLLEQFVNLHEHIMVHIESLHLQEVFF